MLGSLQLISTTLTQVPGRDRLKSVPLSGVVGVATEDLMEGAELELLGDFELLEDTVSESLTLLLEFWVLFSSLIIFALISLVTCCIGLDFEAGISAIFSGSEVFETVFLMQP